MAGEIDLTGTWFSRYEYGEGRYGEHTVGLHQEGDSIQGESFPQPSGSELTLDLTLSEDILEGFWEEKTSPTGEYRGQVFLGVFHLLLSTEANQATGKWAGHNGGKTAVNTGNWTLKKQSKA